MPEKRITADVPGQTGCDDGILGTRREPDSSGGFAEHPNPRRLPVADPGECCSR